MNEFLQNVEQDRDDDVRTSGNQSCDEYKQYVYCIIISAYVHFVSNSRVFTQYPNKEHLGLEAQT
ncbi:MAG: hypothetical protein WBZ36_02935 [Candidatus Nitrosopolaris sp.]